MIRSVKGLYLFYKRIIFPSLVLSLVLPIFGMSVIDFFSGVGLSFFFLLPLFHYMGYEIRYPDEYYFYHNLGFSRRILWLSTIVVAFLVGIVFMLV
jgi:hypothetical protein